MTFVTGTEQRIYGKLIPKVHGTLILMPININWGMCCNIVRYCWKVHPTLTFHLPKLSEIYRITIVNGYNITGNVKQRDIDKYGYLTFDQVEEDTNANYVSLVGTGYDDILWLKNNNTNKEMELYCGNGYNSRISQCVFQGEPDVSYLFDLTETGTADVTIQFQGSDYWTYAIGGYVGYLAIDCSFPGNPFVKHPYTYYGYRYSKYYGFTGPQVY